MKTVHVGDAELHIEHTPRPGAPALLLINSLGTSLEMWNEQLDDLGERYELIRYDARGHGRSTMGAADALSVEDLARDALAVLDACGIARAHLCGVSLGGVTAMYIATQWPDRVLKVVLSNTSAHLPPRDMWDERIRIVLAQGVAPLAESVLARWFTPAFHASHPQRVQEIREMLLACDRRGYAACCAAIRDNDQRESIKTIAAKTLVICGSSDPVTPLPHAEYLAVNIPSATLTMLDAAHLSNIERAAEFNEAVQAFLAA
jgi:3-oxoadipate enol-lactonase